MEVKGGANWFEEVKNNIGGAKWLTKVKNGFGWCKLVYGGKRWFWMIQTGLWRQKGPYML